MDVLCDVTYPDCAALRFVKREIHIAPNFPDLKSCRYRRGRRQVEQRLVLQCSQSPAQRSVLVLSYNGEPRNLGNTRTES